MSLCSSCLEGSKYFSSKPYIDPNVDLDTKIRAILEWNKSSSVNVLFTQLPLWLLWRIWKSRNILVFRNRNTTWWEKDVEFATIDSRDLSQAQEIQEKERQWSGDRSVGRVNKRWKRPRLNWINCNFDASFSNTTVAAKAGWLFRDDNGNLFCAAHNIGNRLLSPLEDECQTLLMAMQHAWMKGYQIMVFEGDSKCLIDLINDKDKNCRVHNWIGEIKVWEK